MKTLTWILTLVMLAQQMTAAQSVERAVASRAALDAALISSANRRAMNLEKVRRLLADPEFARAAARLGDVRRLSDRLIVLDDRTLERLARESDAAAQQTGGGGPSKVLIIVLLTLVILAVVASALAPESS